MKTYLRHWCYVFVVVCALVVAQPVVAWQFSVGLEQAIELAKNHVAKNNIDVSRHFLAKAEFSSCDNTMCWRIEWWLRDARLDGGQKILFVYPDRSIKVSHGE